MGCRLRYPEARRQCPPGATADQHVDDRGEQRLIRRVLRPALSTDRRAQRLEQLVRMLHTPVTLDDGRTVDVAASVGAATPDVLGTRDLTALQRAADAALYDGKHSGRAHLATAAHATTPSVNGRRAGRSGTAVWGRAA